MDEIDRLVLKYRSEHLVEELHSPNKNKRYEACEYLRVAAWIPESAMDALQQATYDPDPEVADAARAAIAIHTGPDPSIAPGVQVAADVPVPIPEKNAALGFVVMLLFSVTTATLGIFSVDATRPDFGMGLPDLLGPWMACFFLSLYVGTRCCGAVASFENTRSARFAISTAGLAALAGIVLGMLLSLLPLLGGHWQWGSGDW